MLLPPITALLNNFAVKIAITRAKDFYVVECICDDGVITKARSNILHTAMVKAFCKFVDTQGLPFEEIEAIKQQIKEHPYYTMYESDEHCEHTQ